MKAHFHTIVDIHNPYEEVPLREYVAFFEAAADGAEDALLGARLGAHLQYEELGPLGVVFVAASSLRAALNRLRFYLHALQSGTAIELEDGAETVDWIYQIEDPSIYPRRQDTEFSLSTTCALIRTLLGPRWAPVEVHFEHSAPEHTPMDVQDYLRAIFKAPVLFDQGVNRLVIDRHDMERQVSRPPLAMAPYLEQHLRDLLRNSSDDVTYSAQVSYLIAKRLGQWPVDKASLADELGLSTRTLQRRLSEEGTSLRALIRAHRARIAEPLLSRGTTPVTAIAHNVGYSDPTVFSRAFKSWHGLSPRTFRQTSSKE